MDVKIFGQHQRMLIDSGSDTSCIDETLIADILKYRAIHKSWSRYNAIIGANGEQCPIKFEVKLPVKMYDCDRRKMVTYQTVFQVCNGLEGLAILGRDYILNNNAIIDLVSCKLTTERASSCQLQTRVTCQRNSEIIFPVKVANVGATIKKGLVEPLNVLSNRGLLTAATYCCVRNQQVMIKVVNLTDKDIVLEEGLTVAKIINMPEEPYGHRDLSNRNNLAGIYKATCDRGNKEPKTKTNRAGHTRQLMCKARVQELMEQNLAESKLDPEQKKQLVDLACEYHDVFAKKFAQMGETDLTQYEIRFKDSNQKPIVQTLRPYRYPLNRMSILGNRYKRWKSVVLLRSVMDPTVPL
jgi:hypothetical protein